MEQQVKRVRLTRRNYFINGRLQGRYMFTLYLLVAVVVVLFILLLIYFTNQSMTITYENSNLQLGATPLMMFKKTLIAAWLLMVLFGFAVALFGMFYSHRIAGPLYKLGMIFEGMSRGVLDNTIRLRKNDEALDVMEKLQKATRYLSGKVLGLQHQTERIEAATARVADPELTEAVRALRELLDDFEIKE